ncbi:AMP-binding protein [Rhodococcoides kyotonense]|uniref:Fatty-acyl-CoA synthase n=1 Tax=Rhodococcoides kyotonense TaxID=398843 RepID=A0A239N6K6_9NOCA|nr:AMP-binding protein [Rhodococcus kyotonensis]SNT50556.1 fatty-acyl-CoA synthase [Rhodococcus kyotonensis]
MNTVAELLLARRDDTDTALLFEDRRIPWATHVTTSAQWAHCLESMLDDGPPHVGVLLDNVPEFSFLLGAAALGPIVLVCLNSTRPRPAVLDDARRTDCQLILTDASHRHLVDDASDITVVDVGSAAWRDCVRRAPSTVPDAPGADDLMALVFTSGTGGDPKAVRCTQSKIAIPGSMLADRFDLGRGDTVYVSMPLFHSNAIMAGWAVALAAGASLALRQTFSASGFLPDIRKFGATYANYVGTPLSYVLATPPHADDSDNPLRVVYGNEATPSAAIEFAQRFGVLVVDGFGSSEGGISIARTPDTPPDALGPIPDGVEVLDSDGRACATGVVGELVNTVGPGMFYGYYRNAEADADRIRGGMYFSGDLAYVDSNGFVYFAGRSSGWMRIRGENVGTAPIERILLRHPGIRAASVYGVPTDGPGDDAMAAIVAPEDIMDEFDAFLTAQSDLALRTWPRWVRVCTDLPRTASHKVLARELRRQGRDTDDPVWWSPEPGAPYRRYAIELPVESTLIHKRK